MASRGKPVYLDNDDVPEYFLQNKDAATGAWAPATGLSGIVVKLSATEGGAEINAVLKKTMSERSGNAGNYYAQYEGDDLRTQLAASYVGKDVYEGVGDGTNVLAWVARRVMATRPV